MIYKGKEYTVFSTSRGSAFNGIITSHLRPAGEERTLCGRNPVKMSKRYQTFSDSDCSRCYKKAVAHELIADAESEEV